MGRGFDSSRQRQLLNDTQLSREVSQRVPADSGRYPSGQRGQTVNLLAYAFGGSNPPLPTRLFRGNSSAVERQPSKLGVAGSNPVSRSTRASASGVTARNMIQAHVAQLAEHALGKGEVSGSSPDMGSITLTDRQAD